MNKNRFNQIIEGCRQFDRVYQKELYQIFYQYTLRTALNYTSCMDEAREIVNDVFLKVFTKINQFQVDQPFKPWLNKITVYTAIDYYRKNIRHNVISECVELPDNLEDSTDVISEISAEELQSMVQQLTPTCRTIINLYAIEGLGHQEIADLLGISVGTSKSNLFKARAKLKQLLNERKNIITPSNQ